MKVFKFDEFDEKFGIKKVSIDDVEITETDKPVEVKTKTYYQPSVYSDDGTNIGWTLPSGLSEEQVFETEDECKDWLENNDYDLDECTINEVEISDEEIEDEDYIIIGSNY